MIDTGAAVSILPKKLADTLHVTVNQCPIFLTAVDGRPLEILGECSLTLKTRKLRRLFHWTFVVVDVQEALLGADFLAHFGLLVDC